MLEIKACKNKCFQRDLQINPDTIPEHCDADFASHGGSTKKTKTLALWKKFYINIALFKL